MHRCGAARNKTGVCACTYVGYGTTSQRWRGVPGGALFTLADLAFAAVANSHRRLTLSVTANITFLRPAKSGYVYADAAEVFNHHRIPFVEVKITNEKGELIAIFTSSGYRKETELPVEDLE